MAKIGIDIRNIGKNRTGDEAVFLGLVRSLAKRPDVNEYFLFTDISNAEKISEIKKKLGIENKNNFKIISLRAANKFFWNAWVLPQYLRKHPVDVFQTQYIVPFFVPRQIKIATIIHDVSFNAYPELIRIADLFFLKTLIPWSLRRADKIIAVSDFTAKELKKYYKINPEKIVRIYNAVSEEFLEKKNENQDLGRVKKKYGLPEKFILYLGTMQPRKNLPLLVEAYALAKKETGDVKLVLAGGKDAHNFDGKIKKIIKAYGLEQDVFLPGFIDEEDKISVYKLALVFCFPSLYEGFGIPVLEAMSLGLPVVASKIPPHEEITDNKIEFFETENAVDLKNKLVALCLNEGLRSKLKIEETGQAEKFSWAKTAEEFLRVWGEM
jgi:glycosyltransferase involved in cell wall biosynthesis